MRLRSGSAAATVGTLTLNPRKKNGHNGNGRGVALEPGLLAELAANWIQDEIKEFLAEYAGSRVPGRMSRIAVGQ
jgi:hypothetical protein